MDNILYEAAFEFPEIWLIPIVILIVLPLFLSIIRLRMNGADQKIPRVIITVCFGCAFAFVTLISVAVGLFQVNMHKKTVVAYQEGNYQVIEGYVENFVPMPYAGRADESFEINGVKFSYCDYEMRPGYNNAKSHGGVITGNGQHLKIGYVYYDRTYGNVIVYIEQIS